MNPRSTESSKFVGMQRICSGIGLEDQTDVTFHVFMHLFSLITPEREDNIFLISNILMYDTTTKKNIKIKEQKRKEELSLITNLTVFAPTAYPTIQDTITAQQYVQEVCKWTAIKSSVVAKGKQTNKKDSKLLYRK